MARKSKATDEAEVPEQSRLIPEKRPKTKLERVKLDLIDIEDIGPRPIAELQQNVREWPIFVPVALGFVPSTGRYYVKSGRRRVLVAREAGDKTIDASVTGENVPAAVVQLADHALRRENAAAELLAIKRILAEILAGDDPMVAYREIAKRLGMPVSMIKRRMKLDALSPELFSALANDAISTNVAEAIVRGNFTAEEQAELYGILSRQGKLTGHDVRKLRGVEDQPALFEPEPANIDIGLIRPHVQAAISRLSILVNNAEVMFALGELAAGKFDPAAILREAFGLIEETFNMIEAGDTAAPDAGGGDIGTLEDSLPGGFTGEVGERPDDAEEGESLGGIDYAEDAEPLEEAEPVTA